jgi:hypothetical protein
MVTRLLENRATDYHHGVRRITTDEDMIAMDYWEHFQNPCHITSTNKFPQSCNLKENHDSSSNSNSCVGKGAMTSTQSELEVGAAEVSANVRRRGG